MPNKSKRSDKLSITKEKKKTLKIFYSWIFLLFAFFLALRYDVYIVRFFQAIRFPILNYFMFTITFLSSWIIFFIVSALFLIPPRTKNLIRVWITLSAVYLIGTGIKIFFARLRPFQAGIVTTFSQFIEYFSSWNSSFPSMHAAIVFSILPFLLHEKRALRNSWIVFAVIVSLSRVYLGVHYLSDVIFGGVLGYLIGILISKLNQRNYTRK